MSKGMVVFSHGKESGPWGTKITRLAAVAAKLGFSVLSIDYTITADPDERVPLLLEAVAPSDVRLVLVGSSMGAYVSTLASQDLLPNGLFLMAPAFYLPGYAGQDPIPCAEMTEIIHGWKDEIVPVEKSIDFARRHGVTLHLIDGDHQLISRLDLIAELFASFLIRLQASAG